LAADRNFSDLKLMIENLLTAIRPDGEAQVKGDACGEASAPDA
jgi:hypothetical protein